MKLAVFADIHSNEQALSACLSFVDHAGVDGYVFLGDNLTDCPYPQRTLALMRAAATRRPTWFVRGNREDYLLSHETAKDDGWRASSGTGSLLYTYQNLTPADLQWMRNMPLTDVIALPGCPPIRIAHASPTDNRAMLHPGSKQIDRMLATIAEPVLLGGHSHFQFRYEANGKQYVNPGSVGIPIGAPVKARYALLICDGDRWRARLCAMPYDAKAEIDQFAGSGLSGIAGVWARATIKTLQDGGPWQEACLNRARQLWNGKEDVPEVCWQQAAQEIL